MSDYKEYDNWLKSLTYDELINEEKKLQDIYSQVYSSYRANNNVEDAKKWRITLTKILKIGKYIDKSNKLNRSPENIYNMAKRSGVKPTARYFEITPSQVRYYIKKIENQNDNH